MSFLKSLRYQLGWSIRETGQALDRAGLSCMGSNLFKQPISRHRKIMNLYDKRPNINHESFIAPNAAVVGDVFIGMQSSVWYGAVVRGDLNKVTIGAKTNVQDRAIISVTNTTSAGSGSTYIGNEVTIGHGAILHACTVEDGATIGMGAVVMDGAVVEQGAMVAAGAVVEADSYVGAGELWSGNPAVKVRNLEEGEKTASAAACDQYWTIAQQHDGEFLPYGTNYQQAEAAGQ